MPRKTSSQTKHDARVSKRSKEFIQQGYEVWADLPNHRKPPTIGGYKPDIVAEKGKQKVIYEVETEDSVDSTRDIKQQGAFIRAARRNPNVKFNREVVD